jgi:hypothetical protein
MHVSLEYTKRHSRVTQCRRHLGIKGNRLDKSDAGIFYMKMRRRKMIDQPPASWSSVVFKVAGSLEAAELPILPVGVVPGQGQ